MSRTRLLPPIGNGEVIRVPVDGRSTPRPIEEDEDDGADGEKDRGRGAETGADERLPIELEPEGGEKNLGADDTRGEADDTRGETDIDGRGAGAEGR